MSAMHKNCFCDWLIAALKQMSGVEGELWASSRRAHVFAQPNPSILENYKASTQLHYCLEALFDDSS
jgi:hypothetical protein